MKNLIANHVGAFFVALQFLTTIPTPRNNAVTAQLQGLSLLWYPVVGLLLGLALMMLCSALPFPFYLQAGLTVTLWVLLTGGLHLDGLADCADAWMGGLGDREKTLRILKDPLCGSIGVLALVILVILKCLAVAAVIQLEQLHWFWVVPLLARTSALALFLTTEYVRPEGLGEILAQHFSRSWARRIILGVVLLTLLFLPFVLWGMLVLTVLLILLAVRSSAQRRLGGFTGDVAGAQIELLELGLLLVLVSHGMA